jgi:hypothetical protein
VAIRGRLDGEISDINSHAGLLSASDIGTIHNIKAITVDDRLWAPEQVNTHLAAI